MILDIHTHHSAPQESAVIAYSPEEFESIRDLLPEGQFCSVGIHPWSLAGRIPSEADYEVLRHAAMHPAVVAIGECGIDLIKGGELYEQINVMKRHIALSEDLQKPLILHCVRGHDHIIAARKDTRPTQPWAIHGFRGKPSIAKLLLDAGCHLSLGTQFNAETAAMIPEVSLLTETDEAPGPIQSVIAAVAAARGVNPLTLQERIASNTRRFLRR